MGLEIGNEIDDLNANWPLGTDPKSQGDDHLRLIKAVMLNDVLSKAAGGTVAGATTFGGTVTLESDLLQAAAIDAANPAFVFDHTGTPTGDIGAIRADAVDVFAFPFDGLMADVSHVATQGGGDVRWINHEATSTQTITNSGSGQPLVTDFTGVSDPSNLMTMNLQGVETYAFKANGGMNSDTSVPNRASGNAQWIEKSSSDSQELQAGPSSNVHALLINHTNAPSGAIVTIQADGSQLFSFQWDGEMNFWHSVPSRQTGDARWTQSAAMVALLDALEASAAIAAPARIAIEALMVSEP